MSGSGASWYLPPLPPGVANPPAGFLPGMHGMPCVPGMAGVQGGGLGAGGHGGGLQDVMEHGMEHAMEHGDLPTSGRARDGENHDAAPGEVNCRLARNLSEKARRDRVSAHITDMQKHLPILNNSAKKVDKITILRIGANQVRMSRIAERLTASLGVGKVPFSHGDIAESLVMDDMRAVCFMVAENSKIVYVTMSVETILGHTRIELFGQDVKKLIHPEDHDVIEAALRPDGGGLGHLESLSSSDDSSSDDTGTSTSASMSSSVGSPCASSPPPQAPPPPPPPPPPPEFQKRDLSFRIQQRPVSRSDSPQYERVHASGYLLVHNKRPGTAQHGHGHRRRSHDASETTSNLLCIVVKLYREMSSASNCLSRNDMYVTRHRLDGSFLYTDQRISIVSGYLPEEVIGKNAFHYMEKKDRVWAQVALKRMFVQKDQSGFSCYRLQTKAGGFIHLRTDGYPETENGQVTSFICFNQLVTEKEAAEIGDGMRKLFGPMHAEQVKKSGVTITEMDDDADIGHHETIKSTSEPPPRRPIDMGAVSPGQHVADSPSSFSAASSDAGGNDFGTRASVLHTTGDVRRAMKRPAVAEGDQRALKRTCPSSPSSVCSTPTPLSAPGTPAAHLPSPAHPLSVDVASPLPAPLALPHSHPHPQPHSLALRGASPSGMYSLGGHLPSDSVSPGVPDVPFSFPEDLGVMGVDVDVSGSSLYQDEALPLAQDTLLSASVCPNGQWGRSGAPDQTGPISVPNLAPALALARGLEDTTLLPTSDLEGVSPGAFFPQEMNSMNGVQLHEIPADSVTTGLVLKQQQLGTNLTVQGEQIKTVSKGLSQVPPNNPERLEIERQLSDFQEQHNRQQNDLIKLHRETVETRQSPYLK